MTIKQRRAMVVTGASSGIGKETAKAFAPAGWHVIGTGRHPERSAQGEAEIRAAAGHGATVDFLHGDMARMAQTMRIAGEIKALTRPASTYCSTTPAACATGAMSPAKAPRRPSPPITSPPSGDVPLGVEFGQAGTPL